MDNFKIGLLRDLKPNEKIKIRLDDGTSVEGLFFDRTSNSITIRNPESDTYYTADFDMIEDVQFYRTNKVAPIKYDPMVAHPNHYQSSAGLEVWDVIEAFTSDLSGVEAFDTGNCIKYICRWKDKNGLQDLNKAMWYLQHLIDHVEKQIEKEIVNHD